MFTIGTTTPGHPVDWLHQHLHRFVFRICFVGDQPQSQWIARNIQSPLVARLATNSNNDMWSSIVLRKMISHETQHFDALRASDGVEFWIHRMHSELASCHRARGCVNVATILVTVHSCPKRTTTASWGSLVRRLPLVQCRAPYLQSSSQL